MVHIHLTQQKCEACEGGIPPLTMSEVDTHRVDVPEWKVTADGKTIFREYVFANFKLALAFIDAVGVIAESEGHHPDLHLTAYKHVRIELSTHAIGGLSKNDFIVAAKIDALGSGR